MTDLRKAAEIKTWSQRCDEHPDHEGIVSTQMIMDRMQEEIDELRQALAQPEQEPFEYWNAVEGWVTVDGKEVFDGRAKQKMMHAAMKQTNQQYRDDPEVMFAEGWYAGFHSRTTGPKREWVGLSNKEVKKIVDKNTSDIWCNGKGVAKAVEARLKEKNGEQFSEKVQKSL
jgi:hypothetical protein